MQCHSTVQDKLSPGLHDTEQQQRAGASVSFHNVRCDRSHLLAEQPRPAALAGCRAAALLETHSIQQTLLFLFPGRDDEIKSVVAAVMADKEEVELARVYELVEQATGMHNGRLARHFKRAVQEALEECMATGWLSYLRLRPCTSLSSWEELGLHS